MFSSSWLRSRLAAASPLSLNVVAIAAAFGTYFCMYAFRKPFTAGTFGDDEGLKVLLITAQLSGYMLSKFIGIKVISEMPAHRRAVSILGLIGFAELALVGFAVLPRPWNIAMLFLNGLPLGMVFGLVLGFLEGRRTSEALNAGLCASFIMSSGVVKSVGHALIHEYGISEYWMPSFTGLLFAIPLLLAVWLLNHLPPPSERDVEVRSQRPPMSSVDRRQFLRNHGLGLGFLILIFVLLTVVRSLRDDFAVEIWASLGVTESLIFAKTETWVAFLVVFVNGLTMLIKGNRAALLASLALCAMGLLTVVAALLGNRSGSLSPFVFMVMVGFGFYIPYVAFHTTIFERLVASVRDAANVGYLMYLADALGYLGYVGVMLFEGLRTGGDALQVFNNVALWTCVVSLVLLVGLYRYYSVRLATAETIALPTK